MKEDEVLDAHNVAQPSGSVDTLARALYARDLRRNKAPAWLPYGRMSDSSRESYLEDARVILDVIVQGIGWPEVRAYLNVLRDRGVTSESPSHFFLRAVRALMNFPDPSPLHEYRDAARALLGRLGESA
jgi:hypothetical protein